ncbi:MAG: hypothetical protein AB7G10_27845, partial [Reyranellaceae bacterium]
LDDDAVRAMIEELATRGLVRRYTVEGVEYLSILDWEVHQRVGRHARRRYPAFPSTTPEVAAPAAPPDAPDHGKPWQSCEAAREAPPLPAPSESLGPCAEADHPDPPPVAGASADTPPLIAMANPTANHSNRAAA